jgi:hypothetical protein
LRLFKKGKGKRGEKEGKGGKKRGKGVCITQKTSTKDAALSQLDFQ